MLPGICIPIRAPCDCVHGRGNRVVNVELQRGRGTNRNYARTEFNANCDIVVRREAAFAKSDGKTGFATAAIAKGDDFGDVVPWLQGHEEVWGNNRPEQDVRETLI